MRMTTDNFAQMLTSLSAAIKAGDSWEGNLTYSVMEPHLDQGEVEVTGAFRIGNLDGQGGMTILESSPEMAQQHPDQ